MQGFDLTENVYHNRWQPFIAYWGLFWSAFLILINGFTIFFHFTAADFLTSCKCTFPFFLGPRLRLCIIRSQHPYLLWTVFRVQTDQANADMET